MARPFAIIGFVPYCYEFAFSCGLLVEVMSIIGLVTALRRKHTLERPLRRRVAWIGAAMLVAGCATVQFDVFPFNVLQNIYLSLDELHRVRHYPETSRDFTYDASRTADAPGREIYVMVIGEAARADVVPM